MSLYNMLFGANPMSDLFLGMVGLDRETVGRFRDAYVEKTKEDPTKSKFDSSNGGGIWVLYVYTRNGGGNRGHFRDEPEYGGPECDCTGCIAEYRLPSHPLYLGDEDDDFDSTYATFRFQVPSEFWGFLDALQENSSPEMKPADRWSGLLAKLKAGDAEDSTVQTARQVMQPVLDKITAALGEKTNG